MLFGIKWEMCSTVRGALPKSNSSCVRKKRMKARRAALLCLFWTIWKERNKRAFENIEKGDQVIKQTFMYIFWEWVWMYIADSPLSMLDLIDWQSSKWGEGVVFCFPLALYTPCIPLYSPLVRHFNIFYLCLSQQFPPMNTFRPPVFKLSRHRYPQGGFIEGV